MPIDKKEFEGSSDDLEKTIVTFLNARRGKAHTSDELIGATSFHVDFDLLETVRVSSFIVANFVAFLHDWAAKGKIRKKVVNNRIYFTAVS